MFKEAFNALDSVRVANMPDSIKLDYYAQRARAYYDLASYNQDTHFSDRYMQEGGRYNDSAIAVADRNSLRFYSLRGGKHEVARNYDKAIADFQVVLDRFSPTYHQYAMAAHSLGNAYKATGDTDRAIEMMARAAIADVKSSTKEAIALMSLAELLYNNGDEGRAYSYIRQALEDADFYGARLRKIQVAAILPIIEGERLATVESQRSRLLIYAIAASLLSLLVVVFAYIIFKQLKQLRQAKKVVTEANASLQEANSKLKQMNDRLQGTNEALLEANKIKEEYIGYSFNMYSEYLDKIEKLKRAIDRRVTSKKYDDLSHVMESVNLKKEREALYLSFDKVFLKLFPNFVSDFNSFFREEDRFILKDNQFLCIELRIFALIRIGINDHEQIAHILEYSVRTIYNYKTKVKNKSFLSNEEFEQKVMEIKAI
jgi:tetratricopeptide (TPR) repeat protein